MNNKRKQRLSTALLLLFLWTGLSAPAWAEGSLIPGGEPIGVRMDVEGVLVAGVSKIETDEGTRSPAEDAGVQTGDLITAVDGVSVASAEALSDRVAACGETVCLTVERDGQTRDFQITPVRSARGEIRLGLWLRDGVAGIGTVTYIDPETGRFGALGHGINDGKGGECLPLREGSVYYAQVVDVKKGMQGFPGELSGAFREDNTLGLLTANTEQGIFGVMESSGFSGRASLPVAEPAQVEDGAAVILTCVAGSEPKAYDVTVSRTGLASGSGRDLIVRITDPELLAATGGIVQGMSGSPILQNGRIIGAVTHVLVNDPTRGYGIYICSMTDAAAETGGGALSAAASCHICTEVFRDLSSVLSKGMRFVIAK